MEELWREPQGGGLCAQRFPAECSHVGTLSGTNTQSTHGIKRKNQSLPFQTFKFWESLFCGNGHLIEHVIHLVNFSIHLLLFLIISLITTSPRRQAGKMQRNETQTSLAT